MELLLPVFVCVGTTVTFDKCNRLQFEFIYDFRSHMVMPQLFYLLTLAINIANEVPKES